MAEPALEQCLSSVAGTCQNYLVESVTYPVVEKLSDGWTATPAGAWGDDSGIEI